MRWHPASSRRIHRLHIRSSVTERRMHARLGAFSQAVRAERGDTNREMWIALAILQKRAFSSAQALHLSVTRRLDALHGVTPAATQLFLPLDEHGEVSHEDEPPVWQAVLGLRNVDHERQFLTSLSDAAAVAAHDESKLAAIRRLLRRIAEPVIIFTEYRDTLVHLARAIGEPIAILHGGLRGSSASPHSRRSPVARGASFLPPTPRPRDSTCITTAASSSTSNCRGTRCGWSSASAASIGSTNANSPCVSSRRPRYRRTAAARRAARTHRPRAGGHRRSGSARRRAERRRRGCDPIRRSRRVSRASRSCVWPAPCPARPPRTAGRWWPRLDMPGPLARLRLEDPASVGMRHRRSARTGSSHHARLQ